VAASLTQLGVQVSAVYPSKNPLERVLGEQIGTLIAAIHRSHGVRLLAGDGVAAFEGEERLTGVVTTNGERIGCDFAVGGVGVEPDAPAVSGSSVAQQNGILVDEQCRTSAADVYAAVRDGRLARNPAAGVDLPRLPTTERRYLTHAQLADLAERCGPHRLLVLVLGYTGLRWGEAAALRVRRIDLLRGRIEVAESVTDVNGRMVYGPPKSHARRRVPVPRFLRDDLAVQLAGLGPDDLVFPSQAGTPLRVQNFRRSHFDRAATAAGLEGLVPHELRHTAASLAIASGASIKGVQSMLGHASAAMTLDRYGHLFGDELDAVAERMDAARADWLRTECGSAPVRRLG
jgi:integrase